MDSESRKIILDVYICIRKLYWSKGPVIICECGLSREFDGDDWSGIKCQRCRKIGHFYLEELQ